MSPSGAKRGVLITLAGNALTPLCILITSPILARAMGAEDRGVLAATTAPLLLATAIAGFGLPEATVYFLARSPSFHRRTFRTALWLTLGMALPALAIIVLTAPLAGAGDPDVVRLIQWSALALPLGVLVGLARAVALARRRWQVATMDKAVASAVRVIAVVWLFAAGALDVFTGFLVLVAAPVCGLIVYLPGLLSLRRGGADPEDQDGGTAGLVSFASRAWIGSLAGILLSRVDQVLLYPLGGATESGLYSVAVNVGDVPLVLVGAVGMVLLSTDARDQTDSHVARAARLTLLAACSLGVVLGGTAPWWLPAIFGAEFAGAVPVAVILLAAAAVGASGSIAGVSLAARGRPGQRSLALVMAAVANVSMLVVLVPPLGAVGAALATLAGNALAAAWNTTVLCRTRSIRPTDLLIPRRADLVSVMRRPLR
jgi:O-antigen/teichoic acid export membrane protein